MLEVIEGVIGIDCWHSYAVPSSHCLFCISLKARVSSILDGVFARPPTPYLATPCLRRIEEGVS